MPRPAFIQAPANLSTLQLTTLSALIVTNEKMVSSGELPIERAAELRWLVAQTLTAFRMPPAYEREVLNDNRSDADNERDLAVLRVTFGLQSTVREEDHV